MENKKTLGLLELAIGGFVIYLGTTNLKSNKILGVGGIVAGAAVLYAGIKNLRTSNSSPASQKVIKL